MQIYAKETLILQKEVQKLLDIKVLVQFLLQQEQFLSSLFLRSKPNEEYRMILNLKRSNDFVPYHHLKMDTLTFH